jgi:hypothetical protein
MSSMFPSLVLMTPEVKDPNTGAALNESPLKPVLPLTLNSLDRNAA